jgi:hypothetical protein
MRFPQVLLISGDFHEDWNRKMKVIEAEGVRLDKD